MKTGFRKALSLLMVALLLVTSVPSMSFAEQTTGTLSVSAIGQYVNKATVTGLPTPYTNGIYSAFCGNVSKGIYPDTLYNTTFAAYEGSRRVVYLINSSITADDVVMQQLIWRIINGVYNNPGEEVENTADALWQQYFQNENGLDVETNLTKYVDKLDTDFPLVDSYDYTKTVFLGNSGDDVQPILVVAQIPKGTVVVKHTFVGNSEMYKEVTLEGFYYKTFTAEPIDHVGYTFTTTGTLTGNYGIDKQIVEYTYTAIPTPPGKVFIKHENPDGTTYAAGTSIEATLIEGVYEVNYTVSQPTSSTHDISLKVGSAPVTGNFTADDITVTFVYTPKVPPTTQAPTQAPTEAPTQAPTEAPTEAAQPTTEAATEVITEEAVAEGDANIFDFDSFIDESEATTEATPEATEEVEILNEATPLADALPQTGQLPVELFYGVGGLITAAGVFLKKRK